MRYLSVMESQYHQFGSSDNSSHEERKIMTQSGKACMSFDSDLTIDSIDHENMSVNVCRYEEGVRFWPLQHPGAAAVNPADGHWDKMYDFKHMAQKWCWFIHVFIHDRYHITILLFQSLSVKQRNQWYQASPWENQQWRKNIIIQFR